jgi:hypothetical protein
MKLFFFNFILLMFLPHFSLLFSDEQFTPNQSNWTSFQSKPLASGNKAHDPDSVSWIKKADWDSAKWDGKTIYDPTKMSKSEFFKAICPTADRVRGIRELFYNTKPFKDNTNPTKAELDEWHRIVINHIRALVGYTENRQVQKDQCMFKRAYWGDERKFTKMWDVKYPGKNGSAAGPCQGSSNAHCGASFIPSPEDQAPYFEDKKSVCTLTAGSEGVFSGPKSNIPWSIKWSRAFCNTLAAEGFWGGHVGPWFHREKFGFSFWDSDVKNNNSMAVLRAKWSGKLSPNLYKKP